MAKQNTKKTPTPEAGAEETLEEKVARLEAEKAAAEEKAEKLAEEKTVAEAKAAELDKKLAESKSKEAGADKKVNGTFKVGDDTYKFKDSFVKVRGRAGEVFKSQDLIDAANDAKHEDHDKAKAFLANLVELEYQGIEKA